MHVKWCALPWAALAFAMLTIIAGVSPAWSHDPSGEGGPAPDGWMNNYTLFLTSAANLTEAYQAAEVISAEGGHVGVITDSGRVMLGWLPPDKIASLASQKYIRAIYQKPVPRMGASGASSAAAPAAGLSETEEDTIEFFNAVASGAYRSRKAALRAQTEGVEPEPIMRPDARKPGKVSYPDLIRNLNANGMTTETLRASGITITPPSSGSAVQAPGNSDYMVGTVAFNAIFTESNGAAGGDPNTYTWTDADLATIRNEITAGLSWWAATARLGKTYNTPLTFVLTFFYNTKTQTRYEPILHSSAQDSLWINEIMGNLGYTSGDKLTRVTAFNTGRRSALNTNWSVTSFIGYNPPVMGAPSTFTDGYFAYAYLRGPYSQLLFNNDGWGIGSYDIVNAHETGHLFGAQDEYYQAGYGGCTSCGASSNGVSNGNCEYCNAQSISCMMRNNYFGLCGYTPGQIGWRSLQNVSVGTFRQDTGTAKTFFAAGEAIQYKANFCVGGPKLGTGNLDLNVRFRADFYGGSLNAPSTVTSDTGWFTIADTVSPPTSVGTSCWAVWWNRSVPATAQLGPAIVTAQLSLEAFGKGAIPSTKQFFVAPFAATTEPAPRGTPDAVSQPDAEIDDGPHIIRARAGQ